MGEFISDKENLAGAHEDTVFARISLLADTVFARISHSVSHSEGDRLVALMLRKYITKSILSDSTKKFFQ